MYHLIDHLNRYISLSKEEELLLSKLHYRKINNKEFILKDGQVCNALYFITKGCFRTHIRFSITKIVCCFARQHAYANHNIRSDRGRESQNTG